MTQDLLTNVGEEYKVDEQPNGATHTWLLYDDSSDSLSETSNLSDISTEPGNSNYSRQSGSVSTKQISGSYGWENDGAVSFDFSDISSSGDTVDTLGCIANFQSSVAGDGSASDNLIANPSLSKSYDTANIQSIDFDAGDINVTLE